jgi:EAL domain-containing protein (putative c-di-GMP-specific phosphodiesterase class I)
VQKGDWLAKRGSDEPPGGSGTGSGDGLSAWLRPRIDADLEIGGGALLRRGQLLDAIAGTGLRMHYQPLVDLRTGAVVAYEALARFIGHPDVTPHGWFKHAGELGMREELELAAALTGLEALSDLKGDLSVCVNLSRHGMMSDKLGPMLQDMPLDRVVLELTEQEEVSDYIAMNRALLRLRADGVRIAVDDAGAGFASMRHIVSLQPDIIKLDATWVTDIEADPMRRAMVTAMASFAEQIDAVLVGEAVETAAQADVLREIGVPWGQGYFFARPAPLEADPEP